MSNDLTAIIVGHREGRLSVASLRSFQRTIDAARAAGYSCEAFYYLDRPDTVTRAVFEQYKDADGILREVDFGDQGHTRNEAIVHSTGKYTAFLDADDLWTVDWLTKAMQYLADKPDTHIAHPAFNYFFEEQATVFSQVDQESTEFWPDLLRIGNYWDALCLCPTQIYRDHPFYTRDIPNGWAFEDWYWNCETVAAGIVHKIVPDTVLFKRRQRVSQTIRASRNKSMIRANPLSRYDHPLFDAQPAKDADG